MNPTWKPRLEVLEVRTVPALFVGNLLQLMTDPFPPPDPTEPISTSPPPPPSGGGVIIIPPSPPPYLPPS